MSFGKEWHEGKDAYSEGLELTDCKYAEGTAERNGWITGWQHAEDNDPLADHLKGGDDGDDDDFSEENGIGD